jgi:hypothetical protein
VNYKEYYVIHGQLTPKEIEQYTGHEYSGAFLADNQFRFIFWGDGDSVVYEETFHDFRGVSLNYDPAWDLGGLVPNPQLYVRFINGKCQIFCKSSLYQ